MRRFIRNCTITVISLCFIAPAANAAGPLLSLSQIFGLFQPQIERPVNSKSKAGREETVDAESVPSVWMGWFGKTRGHRCGKVCGTNRP